MRYVPTQQSIIREPVLPIDVLDDMPGERAVAESNLRDTDCSSPGPEPHSRHVASDGAGNRWTSAGQVSFVDFLLPVRGSNVISANAISILSEPVQGKEISFPRRHCSAYGLVALSQEYLNVQSPSNKPEAFAGHIAAKAKISSVAQGKTKNRTERFLHIERD